MFLLEIIIFDKQYRSNLVFIKEIIETVGIYTERSMAEHFKERCEDSMDTRDVSHGRFRIREVEVDNKPDFLVDYEEMIDKVKTEKESVIQYNLDRGYIDILVGEDGEFDYIWTDKGREKFIGNPKKPQKRPKTD